MVGPSRIGIGDSLGEKRTAETHFWYRKKSSFYKDLSFHSTAISDFDFEDDILK